MKKFIALAAMALVAFAASCDTDNVGPGGPIFFTVDITGVTPAVLSASEDATFTAAVTGGSPAYTYSWNFGGASTPNVSASPAGTTTSITQTLTPSATPQTYTVTVTATDGNGITATDTVTINVRETQNQVPVINSATYNAAARTLTVSVSDPDDGETLTVTATPSAGLNVDQTSKVAAATGPLTATFNVTASDLILGATGTIAVSVSDGKATVDNPAPVNVSIPAIVVPADTIVAIPTTTSAAIGAPVMVIVVQGATANAFQYMNGVGITIQDDADYVLTTFDAGVPDGTPDVGAVNPIDGLWATMNPAQGFLLGGDAFIKPTDLGGGIERWDFNLTPLGGSNLTGAATAGVLFNVQFDFASAGTKTFGFIQETLGVKRTYYSDNATEFFYGDITNDGSIGPNSVTIN